MGLLDDIIGSKSNSRSQARNKQSSSSKQITLKKQTKLEEPSLISKKTKKTTKDLPKSNLASSREKSTWPLQPSEGSLKSEKASTSRKLFSFKKTPKKNDQNRPEKTISLVFANAQGGQTSKQDGAGDDLSRASSESNLHVDPRIKGARPRKSDTLYNNAEKIHDKKNDKRGITKNNNKTEENRYSLDASSDIGSLQRQLDEMASEKSKLSLKLEDKVGEICQLHREIEKLTKHNEESSLHLEQLEQENIVLKNRLRDVSHSPLSDNEKQQLLFESHRQHSSAPASIALNLIDDGPGGDYTTCPTSDSGSNVSEVSVACLQDKINQMQETHYSTNEELQATLQELTDLQRQLTELQQENERLNDEKTLMFDSLCRQTERLNKSRSEVESLKDMLCKEKVDADHYESVFEHEKKLVELLKSGNEEREAHIIQIDQLDALVQEYRSQLLLKDEVILEQAERVKTLECSLDAKHAEHKILDQDLAIAKDQSSGKQIEINRLNELLDNARTKIIELEQERELSEKTELDEILDNARKEKDALEAEVTHLKEQWALSKNESEKLREQVFILQEECKVARNNAKTTQSDLEYKCEKLLAEKRAREDDVRQFQDEVGDLKIRHQRLLEDNHQLNSVLTETQRNLSETEEKNLLFESEVKELRKRLDEENEEWQQFKKDLLTSVRVANDFKTEAQQDQQKMTIEVETYRERVRQLEAQIDKLKGQLTTDDNMEYLKKINIFKSKRKSDNDTSKVDSAKVLKQPSTTSKEEYFSRPPKQSLLQNVVKRNKPRSSTRRKVLSNEERLLMVSLQDMHAAIDPKLTYDELSDEQKMLTKLKQFYDNASYGLKPVAPNEKSRLAISKPLLDSVYQNPKLDRMVKDSSVPTIEHLEVSEDNLVEPHLEEILKVEPKPRKMHKSKSVDNFRSVKPDNFNVSNNNNFSKSMETLEPIINDIPQGTPNWLLTNEQKFAIKFKQSMENYEKTTLVKNKLVKKKAISKPEPDSIRQDKNLEQILEDTSFKTIKPPKKSNFIQRYLDRNETHAPLEEPPQENSDYNEDLKLSFAFGKEAFRLSSDSLTSGELNISTGKIGRFEDLTLQGKVSSLDDLKSQNPRQSKEFNINEFALRNFSSEEQIVSMFIDSNSEDEGSMEETVDPAAKLTNSIIFDQTTNIKSGIKIEEIDGAIQEETKNFGFVESPQNSIKEDKKEDELKVEIVTYTNPDLIVEKNRFNDGNENSIEEDKKEDELKIEIVTYTNPDLLVEKNRFNDGNENSIEEDKKEDELKIEIVTDTNTDLIVEENKLNDGENSKLKKIGLSIPSDIQSKYKNVLNEYESKFIVEAETKGSSSSSELEDDPNFFDRFYSTNKTKPFEEPNSLRDSLRSNQSDLGKTLNDFLYGSSPEPNIVSSKTDDENYYNMEDSEETLEEINSQLNEFSDETTKIDTSDLTRSVVLIDNCFNDIFEAQSDKHLLGNEIPEKDIEDPITMESVSPQTVENTSDLPEVTQVPDETTANVNVNFSKLNLFNIDSSSNINFDLNRLVLDNQPSVSSQPEEQKNRQPKIIDLVPLSTQPDTLLKEQNKDNASSDTLNRFATFYILNNSPSNQIRFKESHIQSRPEQVGSRLSFDNAKKKFEKLEKETSILLRSSLNKSRSSVLYNGQTEVDAKHSLKENK